MTIETLAAEWRGRAEVLAPYSQAASAAFRTAAEELEAALRTAADELLNLREAATESGYSDRRLRELLADGTIPQAGRKGAPRIRRRDLPQRPRKSGHSVYDPEKDAEALLARLA